MAGKETAHFRRSSQVSEPTAGEAVGLAAAGASPGRSTPADPAGSVGSVGRLDKAIFCSLIESRKAREEHVGHHSCG